MLDETSVRIDKYLWAVRIYKTRNQAAEACKKGHIIIDNISVKPSRMISLNEEIKVKKNPVIFTYRVKAITSNRLGAKLVPDYISDITPEEEKLKQDINDRGGFYYRDKGAGRPTKKDRRIIDRITEITDDAE